MLLGILVAGVPFITWDVIFTRLGVWGFNERYLTGINIINLPLEEWMFFITIPVACIFIYEVLILFIRKDYFARYSNRFTYIFAIALLIIGLSNLGRLYTSITFISAAAYLLFLVILIKPRYLGRFYMSYLVTLLPFFLVNGILTGSFIEEEIVWYNNAENLSIRIFTVPIEDSIYGMLLILINISVYEWWKNRNNRQTF
jgi:lycopene cyclase domain-containing protein